MTEQPDPGSLSAAEEAAESTPPETEPIPEAGDAEELTEQAQHPETIDSTATEEELSPPDSDLIPAFDEDAYRVMTLEDEKLIMDELQGRALDVMIYSFPIQGGGLATGFSWAGIAEAVRTLNARGLTRIRVSPEVPPQWSEVKDPEGGDAIMVVIYAEDTRHGGGHWGTGVQPRLMKLKSGGKVPDGFAPHKALSKAQRNATEKLIPLEALEAVKAQYLRAGRVKRIPAAVDSTQDRPELPAALDDEQAKSLVEDCRRAYRETRDINPVAIVPAQFNRMLTQAQHDHGRLGDLLEHLESMRDGEQKIRELIDRFEAIGLPKKKAGQLIARVEGAAGQQQKIKLLVEFIEAHETGGEG